MVFLISEFDLNAELFTLIFTVKIKLGILQGPLTFGAVLVLIEILGKIPITDYYSFSFWLHNACLKLILGLIYKFL